MIFCQITDWLWPNLMNLTFMLLLDFRGLKSHRFIRTRPIGDACHGHAEYMLLMLSLNMVPLYKITSLTETNGVC
jgi:hypothetical protein